MIEGFHGVPYANPLGRTREIIDLVRRGMRREKLTSDGIFKLPLSKEDGAVTGLGKPLKLLTHPERDSVPIYIAALGQKSVQGTAEYADGWLPFLYYPERAKAGLGRGGRQRHREATRRASRRSRSSPAACARSARAPRPRRCSTSPAP